MEATFESAIEGLRQMGASSDEREIVELLQRHGQEEGRLLERYQRFATEAVSPAVRYLVALLLEDEQRHHRLLAELANAVAWAWSENSPVPSTPDIFEGKGHDDRLLEETQRLLDSEHDDAKELRRLQKKMQGYRDTTMWTLVIDTMLADNDKHSHILRYILRQLA